MDQNPRDQIALFPSTRYMGSKTKLLNSIWNVAETFDFEEVLDLFSGSGIVSYMFKAHGKQVLSNDYMAFSANISKALVENSNVTFPLDEARALVDLREPSDKFVSKTFEGLYFTDEENLLIDGIRSGIKQIENSYQRSIALGALVRACLKKRPRGIFTYTGMRYDDGRRDLKTSLADHFLAGVELYNQAVFDNTYRSEARCGDAMSVAAKPGSLVYFDPPYYSPYSDNEYVRRYHFVEGLARDWNGVEIQQNTKTKKFRSYPTPFATKAGAYEAFDQLFHRHRHSILLVSYSSNSLPTLDEMVAMIRKHKSEVEVVPVEHRYSFGNQGHKVSDNKNSVNEYLFVGY